MRNNTHSSITMLRLPTVKDRVLLGRSSIYAAIKRGIFPAPIRLSERAVALVESDVEAWLSARIEASRREASA
jgi:prophage regulatory protein